MVNLIVTIFLVTSAITLCLHLTVKLHDLFPTVLLANVRGSLCTKNDELSVLFSNNSVDIACLTETWLNDGIIDDLIHIPGYSVHRRDRQDGRQGGVVARNSLLATVPA